MWLIFAPFAAVLNRFGLAYLHIIEPRVKGGQTLHAGQPPVAAAGLRKIFKGPIIAAGGFDREGAIKIVENGDADLVAFGRQFISNPDLPCRRWLNLYLWPSIYSKSPFNKSLNKTSFTKSEL